MNKPRLLCKFKAKLSNGLIKYSYPLISVFERIIASKKRVGRVGSHSPIFIIGAPRTGSTILYQALTNAYSVKYIDNEASRWYRNLLFGMWLSHRKYLNSPHDNFKADHGDTNKYGGHAPSECGSFWYKWLPKDRHFVDHDEVTTLMIEGLRFDIGRVQEYFGAPMLFKNLNAGQRLRLISKSFPDAKIIFLRRDPRFVVRSIMSARSKVGVGPDKWWSVMPPNVKELAHLPESNKCAAQVYFLEKQISDDLALFPKSNIRILHYQNLNEEAIKSLAKWLKVKPKKNGDIPCFNHDCFDKLSQREQGELNSIVDNYPFEKDLFV